MGNSGSGFASPSPAHRRDDSLCSPVRYRVAMEKDGGLLAAISGTPAPRFGTATWSPLFFVSHSVAEARPPLNWEALAAKMKEKQPQEGKVEQEEEASSAPGRRVAMEEDSPAIRSPLFFGSHSVAEARPWAAAAAEMKEKQPQEDEVVVEEASSASAPRLAMEEDSPATGSPILLDAAGAEMRKILLEIYAQRESELDKQQQEEEEGASPAPRCRMPKRLNLKKLHRLRFKKKKHEKEKEKERQCLYGRMTEEMRLWWPLSDDYYKLNRKEKEKRKQEEEEMWRRRYERAPPMLSYAEVRERWPLPDSYYMELSRQSMDPDKMRAGWSDGSWGSLPLSEFARRLKEVGYDPNDYYHSNKHQIYAASTLDSGDTCR